MCFCRRIVLVAIQDEGAKEMTSSAYKGLRRIGVRRSQRSYRGSFAFIGYTGPGRKSFIGGVGIHTKWLKFTGKKRKWPYVLKYSFVRIFKQAV